MRGNWFRQRKAAMRGMARTFGLVAVGIVIAGGIALVSGSHPVMAAETGTGDQISEQQIAAAQFGTGDNFVGPLGENLVVYVAGNLIKGPNSDGTWPSQLQAEAAYDATFAKFSGKKVGLQAGHWQIGSLPSELASLRSQTGAAAGGYTEADLNLKVAQAAANILKGYGVEVDVIPATVPVHYQADAFVAIHTDAAASSSASGFKVARYAASAIPGKDDLLVQYLQSDYQWATGIKLGSGITDDMRYYYAFNGGSFSHAVASTTPSAILEMGFLTNDANRAFLTSSTDTVAQGVANSVLGFLAASAS